ncbi:MAG: hypothetical protein H7X80_03450 [bacterium]|nr:hypothetical protein [Candidatus Kapabacteria bacterium]
MIDASVDSISHDLLVGLTGAYSSNHHSGGFRTFPQRDDTRIFEGGSGGGGQFGIAAELILSRFFSIDARAMYDIRPAQFETPVNAVLILTPPNGMEYRNDTSVRADVDYRMLTFDAMLSGRVLELGKDVFITFSVGPSISLVQSATITQWTERYDGSGDRHYQSENSDVREPQDIRYAVKAGTGIDFRASERFWIHARVHGDYGLSEVTMTENWQVNSALIQFDVLYAL